MGSKKPLFKAETRLYRVALPVIFPASSPTIDHWWIHVFARKLFGRVAPDRF